jgi:acyl-coenzyme A synthetase/AMP-(fatty) acid ligase
VKAFIVLRTGVEPDEALVAALRATFPEAERDRCPALFEFVVSLPRTATGKIRRQALRGIGREGPDPGSPRRPRPQPRTQDRTRTENP